MRERNPKDSFPLEIETDGTIATFSARELRELLEWVRANRGPRRAAAIDPAESAPPDEGV